MECEAKKHVTFGLYSGRELIDPEGLLEGGGKQMAHVKFKKQEDIRTYLFTDWLKEAIELDQR